MRKTWARGPCLLALALVSCAAPGTDTPGVPATTPSAARVETVLHPDLELTLDATPSRLTAVAVSAAGQVAVAGVTPAGVYVRSYLPSGAFAWTQEIPLIIGAADEVSDAGFDASGRLYVAATVSKLAGPTSGQDAVVLMFAPDGTPLPSAIYPGLTDTRALRLAIAPEGGGFLAATPSAIRFTLGGGVATVAPAASVALATDGNLFVATSGVTGTDLYCRVRRLTPQGGELASVDVAKGSGLEVLATSDGGAFALCRGTGANGYDGTVARITPGGAIAWSQHLEGTSVSGWYSTRRLAADAGGNLIVATSGRPGNAGSTYRTFKLTPTGQIAWSRDYVARGPIIGAESWAVAVGVGGEIYVTGYETTGDDLGSGIYAITTIVYSADGVLWGRHSLEKDLSSSALAYGRAIAYAPSGHVVVAGHFDDSTSGFDDRGVFLRLRLDRDGDGLLDVWELGGLDAEGDGVPFTLPGARVGCKDLYVEADLMDARYDPADVQAAIALVRDRYAQAPIANPDPGCPTGITLHMAIDEEHLPRGQFPESERWALYEQLRATYFLDGPDPVSRALTTRYALFGEGLIVLDPARNGGPTGEATNIPGSGFQVWLGNDFTRAALASMAPVDRQALIASVIMHELGHTLGLQHGGGDALERKPNYHSVMSYLWQLPPFDARRASWSLGYSAGDNRTLDERAFVEADGLGGGAAHDTHLTEACDWQSVVRIKREHGPIDLDEDGDKDGRPEPVDLNCDNSLEVLRDHDDWAAVDLRGSFMGPPWTTTTGVPGAPFADQLLRAAGGCGVIPGLPGCACVPGAVEACSPSGGCGAGSRSCQPDGTWSACVPVGPPPVERCDAVDNDCDGATDEGFPGLGTSCSVGSGACQRSGTTVCSADGSTVACSATPGLPEPEVCNGVDDDCGGSVDESDPSLGLTCTVGVGACARSGQLVCTAGALACTASPGVATQEACNGADDDCDGTTDEGCVAAVHLLAPRNGATTGSVHVAANLRPTLRWQPASGATRYEVQLTDQCPIVGFTSCGFGQPTIAATVVDSSFTPATSLPVSTTVPVGTRYFWRVRGCNATACGPWATPRYLDVGRLEDDFNGDGTSDLVVGAPGASAPAQFEGIAHVHPGTTTGVAVAPPWTRQNPLDQAVGYFGARVAAVGDLDADGFADAAVSAYWQDAGATNEGVVYVYRGSSGGLSITARVLDNPDNVASGMFGASVDGAGDLDGDGYADLVVGASGQGGGGAAFVYRGSSILVATTPSFRLSHPDQQAAGSFGATVAGGFDVDGDGLSDLVVADPYADYGASDEGAVFVFRGASAGPPTLVTRVEAPTNQAQARFGAAVAGGDLDGDGFADLVIGADRHDAGATDEGGVWVFRGGAWTGAPAPAQFLDNPANQASGQFGYALTCDDFNRDGRADLAIGADGFTSASLTARGAVWVFRGTGTGVAFARQLLGPVANGRLGSALATGDYNRDGFADLAAAARLQASPETAEGNVHTFHGGSAGIASSTPSRTLDNPRDEAQGTYGTGLD